MYMTIDATGTIEEHEGVPDAADIREYVGGDFEVKSALRDGEVLTCWFASEGKALRQRNNAKVTRLLHEAESIAAADHVAGDVLLTGPSDADGNTLGIEPGWLAFLRDLAAVRETV